MSRADDKGLALFPKSGAPFATTVPGLRGLRTRLVKDFPNHVVFYVEREDSIEVVRVLRGGQDMDVEVTRASDRQREALRQLRRIGLRKSIDG